MTSLSDPPTERVGRTPPRPWSPRGVALLLRKTVAEAWEDRIFGLAAEAGFWSLLSMPPLALVLLGLTGYVVDVFPPHSVNQVEQAILQASRTLLTESSVRTIVKPAVDGVLSPDGRAGIVSLGAVLSLWSGSTAMATYVNTLTIAYDLRNVRSAVRSRLLALLLFLGAVLVGVVMLPLLVLGPEMIIDIAPAGWAHAVADTVHALYWPVVALGSVAVLATLYHLSVPVRTPWHRDLPGAVVAMVLWVIGSVGLRVYLTYAFTTASTYRQVAAPIAILLFFYITALAVLFGAELNAELDKLWPERETARARRLQRAGGDPAPPPQ